VLDRLFVYGSLRPGGPNEHVLNAYSGTWEPASVTGALINKGWGADLGFPGIILDEKGSEIEGYIFTPAKLSSFWATLDEFEGEAYLRTLTKVKLKNGNLVDAYVYTIRDC
jgi:gamma-glutamylcyclotransferase (GGCT)/AIG2-like uncharacterized protein YtfP